VTTWWATDDWHRYEEACGLEPGTREQELSVGAPHHIVGLAPDRDTLWRRVRKSYKPIIHKAEREYDILLCHPADMDAFRRLHAIDAGRETRPRETWDMMAEWVDRGILVLVGAKPRGHAAQRTAGAGPAASTTKYSEDWVAFAAFYTCEPAYYGHAASLVKNVNHALVWRAMLELKQRGCRRLDMGEIDGSSRDVFRSGFSA